MLQRIQTLYLLAALAFCIGCLCSPIAHFLVTGTGEPVRMYNLWLTDAQGAHLFSYCPVLMALLLITSTALVFDIFLFARRALQMRLATFCIILLAAWCIAYGILVYLLAGEMQATWRPTGQPPCPQQRSSSPTLPSEAYTGTRCSSARSTDYETEKS
jgi:hypothetical protein